MTRHGTHCTPAAAVALLITACAPSAPPSGPATSPHLVLNIAPPWKIASQHANEIRLQLGEGDRGAILWWDLARAAGPGVSLVSRGQTIPDRGVPLVDFGLAEIDLRELRVETQELDLVVRAEGAPLRALTEDSWAKDRPAVTQVRVRPRPKDWRVIVDGVTTWRLPPAQGPVEGSGGHLTLTTQRGTFELQLEHLSWQRSRSEEHRWSLSTEPAATHRQPYTRSTLTWTPSQ